MAYARVFYPPSGTDYSIPFPYQSQSELVVEVGGVATSAWTLLNPGMLRFNTAPTALVMIERSTQVTTSKTVYADASVLHAADLNTADTQLLYSIQEAQDLAEAAIGISDLDGVNFDARGLRITNAAPASMGSDAVTYAQVSSLLTNPVVSLSGINWVGNVTALAALAPPASPGTPTVYTRGRVTDMDGLAAFWEWVPGSTTTPDNISVVQPTAGGVGRWIKLAQDLSVGIQGTVTLTASYTVVNTDKTKTFVLTGANQNITTVNAASGYDPDFQVVLINNKARGETLSINGITSFILWPGQTMRLVNAAGTWVILGLPKRWYPSSGGTFYVDPSGNDANDGLVSTAPRASIVTTWNLIRDFTDGVFSIQLTPGGTYAPIGELDGDRATGFGRLITIVGDPTMANPAKIQATSGNGVTLSYGAWVQFSGLQFGSSGSGGAGVVLSQKSYASFDHCIWAAWPAGYHIAVEDGSDGNITGPQKITGGAAVHWFIQDGAKLIAQSGASVDFGSIALSFSTSFLYVAQGSRVSLLTNALALNSASVTAVKYNISRLSFGTSNGNGLPGNTAGTTDATSAWY